MTIAQLQKALEEFDDDCEVMLSDGCCGSVTFDSVKLAIDEPVLSTGLTKDQKTRTVLLI